MGSGDVSPAEMPDYPFHLIAPLDDNTAERLLSGRLDPDDAPPAYARVATLLRAAGAPATADELSGQAAALAAFRATRPAPARAGSDPTRAPDGLVGSRGRLFGLRGRLVTVALAGTLAAGGLWIADGARLPGELGSPSGGPGAGGSGSGVSGSGVSGSGVGGSGSAGLLRPAGAVAGSGAAGRGPVPPTASERATARHGGGLASRGGGSAHGSRPAKPPKQKPKPKPPKQKPEPKSSGPRSSAAKPEASKGEGKAQPGKGGNPGAGGS